MLGGSRLGLGRGRNQKRRAEAGNEPSAQKEQGEPKGGRQPSGGGLGSSQSSAQTTALGCDKRGFLERSPVGTIHRGFVFTLFLICARAC